MAPNPLPQAVASSQQDSDTSSPPPYTNAEGNTSLAEVPRSLGCPHDWQTRDYNLTFTLAPTFAGIEHAQPPWKAFLSLKVKYLPGLMKRGFYWSEANLQKNGSYLLPSESTPLPARQANAGWQWARCYPLRDLAQDPQWIGTLEVFSHHIQTLREFRVSSLSVDMIFCGFATDWEGRILHVWNALDADVSLNTIYDEMPMDGW